MSQRSDSPASHLKRRGCALADLSIAVGSDAV